MLSKREKKILKAFIETLIPVPSRKLSYSIEGAGTVDSVEEHVGHFSRDKRIIFRLLLFFFDYGAFFFRLHFKTFRKMDQKWKMKYLESWRGSRWAPEKVLWRFLCAISFANYYSNPRVSAELGYAPVFGKALPEPEFPKENLIINIPQENIKEECDICIIGSGAGGGVAAAKLAEAGYRVIVLEEGGHFTAKDFGKDAVSMTKMIYRDGGVTNTFGWPAILVPLGVGVGGTTLIHSGTCLKVPDKVFAEWVSDYGLTNWTPSRMEKYYKEVAEMIGVAPADESLLQRNSRVFRSGLEKMKISGALIPRDAPGCDGSGVCNFGCPVNAKQGSSLGYVPKALRAGAKLYTHCRASRFLFNGSHADTVIANFLDPKTKQRISGIEVKARVIILACGTFHTPVQLMRSHVPNVSGQIGHNLTLHPAAKVMGLFDKEIRQWEKEIPQGYHVDALADQGIMLEGIYLPPPYTAPTILHIGEKHRKLMEQYNNIASFGMLVHDVSHGRILSLPGNKPLAMYNINKIDLPKYIKGISLMAEAFFAAGAKSVMLPIHTIPELTREEGVAPLRSKKIKAKDLDLQAFHPLGTCRMGADPRNAVCDQYGRFYGLDNVFIADGSIFPTSLGVNPMLTIMASAAKIATYIDREVL